MKVATKNSSILKQERLAYGVIRVTNGVDEVLLTRLHAKTLFFNSEEWKLALNGKDYCTMECDESEALETAAVFIGKPVNTLPKEQAKKMQNFFGEVFGIIDMSIEELVLTECIASLKANIAERLTNAVIKDVDYKVIGVADSGKVLLRASGKVMG